MRSYRSEINVDPLSFRDKSEIKGIFRDDKISRIEKERLIMSIINQISKSEGKIVFFENNTSSRSSKLDAYFPIGFLELSGSCALEVVSGNYNQSTVRKIQDTWINMISSLDEYENIVFIIDYNDKNRSVSISKIIQDFEKRIEKIENAYEKNKKPSISIISVYQLIDKLPEDLFLRKGKDGALVSVGNFVNDLVKNSKNINLKEAFRNDKLTLFLGAGVSSSAGVPDWEALISELWKDYFKDIFDEEIETDVMVKEIESIYGNSPTIRGRLIKNAHGDKLYDKIRAILSKYNNKTSPLIDSIVDLCMPLRDSVGLSAVFTFNYDCLIENHLNKRKIKYSSIYSESESPSKDSIPIFHVHGFFETYSGNIEKKEKDSIVFSEDSYHLQISDIYSWNNIQILNHLRYNTCLFIGCSMTDPNLRRLLDTNYIKGSSSRHYAMMKLPKFSPRYNSIEDKIKMELLKMQINTFDNLGVEILWFMEFSDYLPFIHSIKD